MIGKYFPIVGFFKRPPMYVELVVVEFAWSERGGGEVVTVTTSEQITVKNDIDGEDIKYLRASLE